MRWLSAAAAALIASGPAFAQRAAAPTVQADPAGLCGPAIAAAERDHGVPPGLLGAIARVESGRSDPRTGQAVAWPWTINAEGQGRFFATKAEAVAATAALLGRGVRLIDVGCMQVNLHHHPQAFPNLEAAFDPAANTRYAGLFLRRLQAARGDWPTAAAHYHSATPEFGDVYRAKVMSAWLGSAVGGTPQTARLAQIARASATGTTMTVRFAGKPMTVRIAGGRVEAWPASPPARGWSVPAVPGSALTVAYTAPGAPRRPGRNTGVVELAEALRSSPLVPPTGLTR
jgi:hypothetical protein